MSAYNASHEHATPVLTARALLAAAARTSRSPSPLPHSELDVAGMSDTIGHFTPSAMARAHMHMHMHEVGSGFPPLHSPLHSALNSPLRRMSLAGSPRHAGSPLHAGSTGFRSSSPLPQSEFEVSGLSNDAIGHLSAARAAHMFPPLHSPLHSALNSPHRRLSHAGSPLHVGSPLHAGLPYDSSPSLTGLHSHLHGHHHPHSNSGHLSFDGSSQTPSRTPRPEPSLHAALPHSALDLDLTLPSPAQLISPPLSRPGSSASIDAIGGSPGWRNTTRRVSLSVEDLGLPPGTGLHGVEVVSVLSDDSTPLPLENGSFGRILSGTGGGGAGSGGGGGGAGSLGFDDSELRSLASTTDHPGMMLNGGGGIVMISPDGSSRVDLSPTAFNHPRPTSVHFLASNLTTTTHLSTHNHSHSHHSHTHNHSHTHHPLTRSTGHAHRHTSSHHRRRERLLSIAAAKEARRLQDSVGHTSTL